MFASLKDRLRRRSAGKASKSGYGPDKDTLRYKVSNWLLTAPRATSLLALSTVLIVALVALIDISVNGETLFTAEENEPELVFTYLRGFYFLGLGLLFPVLVLCFLRYWRLSVVIW